jgi:hypothetical protein
MFTGLCLAHFGGDVLIELTVECAKAFKRGSFGESIVRTAQLPASCDGTGFPSRGCRSNDVSDTMRLQSKSGLCYINEIHFAS